MERISDQSLALAIEKCQTYDRYCVLIVVNTWQCADYWSWYIVDKYSFAFKCITKNKFRCTNGSTIYLISQSSNACGRRADLILYDIRIDYETYRILEFIETRPIPFKLNCAMEEQVNDTL